MLTNVTADNAANFSFALSDGTPVTFSKVTPKGRIQVRLPSDHEFGDDPLRIFDRDGNHYKDELDGLTLSATPVTTSAPTPTSAPTDFLVYNGALYQRVPGTVSVA